MRNVEWTSAMWFVFVSGEQPSLQTVSYTKRGAIKHWTDVAGHDWRYWRRHGYRAMRAKIAWYVVGSR